jgi:hypothetical protein
MKTANLIQENQIIVQMEYEVDNDTNGTETKNWSIHGEIFTPAGWNSEGEVIDRHFLVSFSSNWECETVLKFMGEYYGKENYTKDDNLIAYYQTGSVHGLIDISRAMFLIHHILELELTKTNTYMCEEDNAYAKTFNILEDCTIEILHKV